MKRIIERNNMRPVIAILYQLLVVLANILIYNLSENTVFVIYGTLFFVFVYPLLLMLFPIMYFKVDNQYLRLKNILVSFLLICLLCFFIELCFYNLEGSFTIKLHFQDYSSFIYLAVVNYIIQPAVFVIVFFYYINDKKIHYFSKTHTYIYVIISSILFSLMFYPYIKMIFAGFIIGITLSFIHLKNKNVYFLIILDILIAIITSIIVIYT